MKFILMKKLILEIEEVTNTCVEISYVLGPFGRLRLMCRLKPKDGGEYFVTSFEPPFEMNNASDKFVFDSLKGIFIKLYSNKITKG